MPEMAKYVKNLTIIAAYPDLSGKLKVIMTRDNFIDALQDDDVKIRQSRPPSLLAALESAINLQSFRLAF